MIFEISMVVLLLYAAYEDIKKKSIPIYVLAISGALSTIAVGVKFFYLHESPVALLMTVIPGILLLAIAFMTNQSLGYGDGLLVLSMGPVFGLEKMILGMFLAFFLSSIISLLLYVLKKVGRKTEIPFVPFISIGMGVMALAQI